VKSTDVVVVEVIVDVGDPGFGLSHPVIVDVGGGVTIDVMMFVIVVRQVVY
jgi:hypothetical protein